MCLVGFYIDISFETELTAKISGLTAELNRRAALLSREVEKAEGMGSSLERARFYQSQVFDRMAMLRQTADELETMCAAGYWPYPSYGDLLFSVK